MIQQGQVGPQTNNDGALPPVRLGKQGDVIMSECHGPYWEQTYRGNTFTAFINALTLASTHATPIAAGTGTPIIGIMNPVGSGKYIVMLKTATTNTSGTPGGPLLWNLIPNPQNITATPSTAPTNNLNLQTVGSVAKLFNNVALTASTVGTAFRPFGGPAAIADGAGVYSYVEEHKGELVIPPGYMLALAATAAGTSHVMSAFCVWEEIPV
jgi:hypothetical protein